MPWNSNDDGPWGAGGSGPSNNGGKNKIDKVFHHF